MGTFIVLYKRRPAIKLYKLQNNLDWFIFKALCGWWKAKLQGSLGCQIIKKRNSHNLVVYRTSFCVIILVQTILCRRPLDPCKWNLNRIDIPHCDILYLPFDTTSNGFLLKAWSLPYGIFVGGGEGCGGELLPIHSLNIQTMFSQPTNFEIARTLKLNQGEQIAMFLPRTKSWTSSEVKEEASEPRS